MFREIQMAYLKFQAFEPSMVAQAWNPSTWEVDTRRSGVQAQSSIQRIQGEPEPQWDLVLRNWGVETGRERCPWRIFTSTILFSIALPLSGNCLSLLQKRKNGHIRLGQMTVFLEKSFLGLPLVSSNPKAHWPFRHMVKEFVTNLPQFSSRFLRRHNPH